MVEYLCHKDSYLKEFETVVNGINHEEGAVSLDKTAYYAAGGRTHVLNTKEVGKIKVTDYKSKGKNNKRIYIELEDKIS